MDPSGCVVRSIQPTLPGSGVISQSNWIDEPAEKMTEQPQPVQANELGNDLGLRMTETAESPAKRNQIPARGNETSTQDTQRLASKAVATRDSAEFPHSRRDAG